MGGLSRRRLLAAGLGAFSIFPGTAQPGLLDSLRGKASLSEGSRFAFLAGPRGKIAAVDVNDGRLETTLELPHEIGRIVPSDTHAVLFATDPKGQRVSVVLLQSREIGVVNDLQMRPDFAISNPEDSHIAFGSCDGVVSAWSYRSNAQVVRASGLGPVTNLTFGRSGRFIYAMQEGIREVGIVDLAKGWPDRPIMLPGDAKVRLDGLSRSLDGGAGFVALPDEDCIALIDLTENTLHSTIPVPRDPGRVYASSNGFFFLVPHREGRAVTVISTETMTTLRTIETGFPVADVLTGWLDTAAIAMPATGSEAALIDLDRLQLAGRLDLGGTPGPGLVTADTRTIVAPLPETGEVALIDVGGRKITKRISTGLTALQPPEMAVSSNICH